MSTLYAINTGGELSEEEVRRRLSAIKTPITPAQLAEEVRAYIARFCVLPSEECYDTAALWVFHTYAANELYTTPRLAALSPEFECGKSRLLEILASLCFQSLPMLNAHAAPVFRSLGAGMRTVFIDEADLIWKQATKDDGNGDLQALINGGYRRGMCNIVRCIGPHHTPTEFDAFSPVVLAGVGDCIPEGVLTRSIIFRMRRKLPTEKLEPYKPRAEAKTQKEIRQRLEAWATVNTTPVAEATPDMPPGLGDRHCEIWEPLVSVADSLKGRWPEAVRKACEALTLSAKARQSSLGVRLLGDIRSIFAKVLPNQYGEKAIHSKDLTDWLVSGNNLDADSPWASLKGFPLSVRYLATLLARYEIRPEKITLGAHTLQGYYEKAFAESWVRYLTPFSASPESPESPESNGMAAMVGMVPQRKSMCEACADDRPGECSRRTMQGSCWAQKHPEMLS